MSDEIIGPANPNHPDHVRFITEWTRRRAASDVIIDPLNPRPPTPEQLLAGGPLDPYAPEPVPAVVPVAAGRFPLSGPPEPASPFVRRNK